MEIQEDEASDLLETIEQSLRQRQFGPVVRLQVDSDMPGYMVDLLATNLEVAPDDIYMMHKPLGMSDLMSMMDINRPDLKDVPFVPAVPPQVRDLKVAGDIFAAIRKQDILLHHPYDSFNPVVDFVRSAAIDPNVLAIKQTLYRVGKIRRWCTPCWKRSATASRWRCSWSSRRALTKRATSAGRARWKPKACT